MVGLIQFTKSSIMFSGPFFLGIKLYTQKLHLIGWEHVKVSKRLKHSDCKVLDTRDCSRFRYLGPLN